MLKKITIGALSFMTVLAVAPVWADEDGAGQRIEDRLDRKGDRIEQRLD